MTTLQRFEHWGDAHHPKWLDIIRIVLGLFLCYKGYDFLQNSSSLTGALSTKTSFGDFTIIALSHYVVFAHIIGGILLVVGFLTRFACLIQIPILLGAIIFISFASDVLKPYNELFLSVIVLLLLFYFLIAGNGPWALKIKDNEKKHV
ncbi:MAG: DoxX family protein [Chitinophagaceae bacterium]|nr:DoxX family protein [Chitinophagaceae bacterium]